MRTLAFHLRSTLLVAAGIACCCAVLATQRPADAATSGGTVVGATVPSAITLDNQCHSSSATSIGLLTPSAVDTTDTGLGVCRFGWESTNDNSMLRIHQADRTGNAMVGQVTATTTSTAAGSEHDIDGKGTTYILQGEWAGADYRLSRDSGGSFIRTTQPGTYKAVSVVDDQVAWRAGNSGVQVTTTLGSVLPPPPDPAVDTTWTTVSGTLPVTCPGQNPEDVAAVSATTAWLVCGMNAYLTTNSGGSWSDGGFTVPNPKHIEAVSATTAYAVGYGQVARSNNSNASWTPLGSALTGNAIQDVSQSPASSTVAWVVDSNGRAYRTSDTGTTWTQLTAPPEPFDGWAIDAVSDTVAIATGSSGIAYRVTHTGGASATWTRFRTPINGTIHQVVALDASNVMVMGFYGSTYVTSNGGTNWTTVFDARDAASDTAAIDKSNILTSDSAGRVRLTTNGGTAWSTLDTGLGMRPIRGVALHGSASSSADMQVYAVSDEGTMAISRDGGTNWQQPTTGTSEDLWDVDVRGDGVALAVGGGGTILRSTDFGTNWTTISTGGATLYRVELHPSGIAVAVGVGGLVKRSNDSGATWTTPASGTTVDLQSVDVASGSVVYAAGTNKLLKSTDGGQTWSTLSTTGPTGSNTFSRVAASNESTVWIFTSYIDGWIPTWAGRSIDGGTTWTRPFGSGTPEVLSPLALDTGTVLIPGEGGQLRVSNPPPSVADYSAGGWASGTSRFGVCLQALGGSATAGTFTPDGNGTCIIDALDSDPWYGVPTTPTKIGQVLSTGSGSVDLVWGLRAATGLAPGQYTAGIVVTAVAPNA